MLAKIVYQAMLRITALASALFFVLAAQAQSVGEPLPLWQPGYLDIHQINTGRGDCALLVFPDGTSLLVDAGDGGWDEGPPRGVVRKPNGSRSPGEWIARYARRALRRDAEAAIDYGYVTHFHGDHIGGFDEVAAHIPIRKLLDRGWPNYDYPFPMPAEGAAKDYRAFVESRPGGMKVERFQPGRTDQIKLLRAPEKYPSFEVRNLAANGEVWTGVANVTRKHFPERYGDLPRRDWPSENQSSMAIRVSYGAFDYYTGGDMPGTLQPGEPPWHDVETPVAKATGPVEVAVANHHGNRDSTNAFFVRTLRPRLWILPVWSSDHPGHDVLARMFSTRLYPGDRDVLATNMPLANKHVIGPLLDRLLSSQGHIVVRVRDGGASYQAIILEDSDESMRVTAVYGPYQAR